jgi:hypothetical protein
LHLSRGLDLKALNGGAVLLAAEVADSSLAYDTGRKTHVSNDPPPIGCLGVALDPAA